jgi:asparagine synthase (glutamine-hydrolysing)
MCGIVGLTGPGSGLWIRAMRDALSHRGPDDSGVYVNERLALGHRRLSIIDLSEDGRQPMESGELKVTFNGEIYNYQELKEELEAKGYQFRTKTDTEVLLHGYQAWGRKLFGRLNGMFALALYDKPRQRLIVARDRCGQKPLYYSCFRDPNGRARFAFASELRALMQCPLLSKSVDPNSLIKFLSYEYLPVPNSILSGVSKLPGGSMAVYDLNSLTLTISRFWTPRYSSAELPIEAASEQLRERLVQSLKYRLQADVPLGLFLSGGVDSSTLLGLLCKDLNQSGIKTFSIGFSESSFDESDYAKTVASHFGAEHRCEIFDERQIIDIVPRVLDHMDEPFSDPSILPTYMLSELTRKHVTVALGGDGGDELFAGYDPFKAWQPANFLLALLPSPLMRSAMRRLVNILPVSDRNMSFEFRLKRLLRGLDYGPASRHTAWLSAFEPKDLRALLSDRVLAMLQQRDHSDSLSPRCLWEESVAAWREAGLTASSLNRQINYYMRTYLQEDILTKVDRASMAHSLEVRAPFLDPELIDWACQIPDRYKFARGRTKVILKHMASGFLPKEILQRPKKGFGIPVSKWLRGPLRPWLEELLSEQSLKRAAIFRSKTVQRLLHEHMSRRRDRRKELWALAMVMAWHRRFMN